MPRGRVSRALSIPIVLALAACASPGGGAEDEPVAVEVPFEAVLRAGGQGEALTFPGGEMRMLYHGAAPDGGVAVLEVNLPPKTLGAPPHTHTGEDEYFYVVAGRIGFLVGEEEHQASAGAHAAMPRGLRHAYWNGSDEPARVLVVIVPGSFGGFFEEVSAELRARRLTDREAIGRLLSERAAAHGCTVHEEAIGPLIRKHGLR